MSDIQIEHPSPAPIERLLLRNDIWRGRSQCFSRQSTISTGRKELDQALLNQGWPQGGLIEVCQQKMQAEWQLFSPAFQTLSGLIVLLNPPQLPFCQALIQTGIDLNRLVVVTASNKNHFIACFLELAKASVGALMAWQPNDNLSYTELRKCALAAADGTGLSVILRPPATQQQSSPAALRIFARLAPAGLELTIFKQKGFLQTQQTRPIVISLPDIWKPVQSYSALYEKSFSKKPAPKPRRLASVTPLRGSQ